MFLPIGDSPNPRNFRAWVTWALMVLNGLVYLFGTVPLSIVPAHPADPRLAAWLRAVAPEVEADQLAVVAQQVTAWDLFVYEHGFLVWAPSLIDLFTAMFMHGGLLHVGGNLLFLWIYGDNVEHRLGRLGYLMAYLGTGAFSTLVFALLAEGNAPLIGASGAISGVLGLYALLFPGNRVKVWFVFRTISVPAWLVLGFYLLVDNLLPLLLHIEGGVAHGAHVGGFLGGVALGFVGERRRWRWPWTGEVPRRRVAEGPGTSGEDLAQSISAGRVQEAIALFGRVPRRAHAALSVDQRVRLADWLEAAGYDASAERLLRSGLSSRASPEVRARVHLALGLARLRAGQEPIAWQHLRRVRLLAPGTEPARAAEQALQRLRTGASATPHPRRGGPGSKRA